MDKEELFSFDNLYKAFGKCCQTVGWKNKVKHWKLNTSYEITRLRKDLLRGTYHPKQPHMIHIFYPKQREAMSIEFRDRIVQRVINDLVLYPNSTRSFILDNCSCQKGKGTGFARDRIKQHLRNYYINHGTDGWVIQIDIHHYYPTMNRNDVKKCFRKFIDEDWLYEMVSEILDSQEFEDGYSPGSQMIQIAGIALLNPLDHYIKERLRVKHYVRYMDDFWLLVPTKDEAERDLAEIKAKLKNDYGFDVNPDKTHIAPLSKSFDMLGFRWRLSKTGKVVQNLLPENVRHERKKLLRMAHKGVSKEVAQISFNCWVAHASNGQNKQVISRMRTYFDGLFPSEA